MQLFLQSYRYHTYALLLILLVASASTLYNVWLPLHPDEAYYWLWSKKLDLSYYDHPPMVAYAIKAVTVIGDAPWIIRMVSVFATAGMLYYLFRLANAVYGPRTAWWSVLALSLLPVTQMAFSITTPDAPLSFFWAMALWYGYLAVTHDRWRDYLLAGAATGLALLSKYTAALLLLIFFLFLLLRFPRRLAGLKPWVAVGMALLVFSPVIIWNSFHQWISFGFQSRHVTAVSQGVSPEAVGEYLGGLLLVFTPVFFGALIWVAVRYKEWWSNTGKAYMVIATLSVLGFFMITGCTKKMEPNWYGPVVISGIAVAVSLFQTTWRFAAALAVALLFTLPLKFPKVLALPPEANLQSKMVGYAPGAQRIGMYLNPSDWICADSHTMAAMAVHAFPDRIDHVIAPFSKRSSMFTYWDAQKQATGQNCVVFAERELRGALERHCMEASMLESWTDAPEGLLPRTFYYYRCDGIR